jgi:tetratricopeptide (TPR) repeat protein
VSPALSIGPAAVVAASGGSVLMFAGALLLGGVVLLGGGALWLLQRRRAPWRRRGPGPSPAAQPGPGAAPPAGASAPESLESLRERAGSLLVSTDDAIAHSEQELAFAQAQYGQEQTGPFREAIDRASGHLRHSFQLQRQLEDDIPDSEDDRRAWLTEIVRGCEEAQRSLRAQERGFAELRRLELDADRAVERLAEAIEAARRRLPEAERELDRLRSRYAESAVETVVENVSEARERLGFAQRAAGEAREALAAADTSEAVLDVRAGEEAVGQVDGLVRAIARTSAEMEAATRSLEEALSRARADLAEAHGLLERGGFGDLAGSAAGVESVVEGIERERAAGPSDPLAHARRLAEARAELDRGLRSVRDQNQQDRAARETLAHTLVSAQARLSSASDFLWSRRGAVRAEARTRLHEAERHLETAQRLRAGDPSEALTHANEAIRLAEDAQRMAMGDTREFSSERDRHDAGGMDSAALGGILLGTLLSGGGRGRRIGGSFGGGFGGGRGDPPGGYGGFGGGVAGPR